MFMKLQVFAFTFLPVMAVVCPDYSTYSMNMHAPFSVGRYNLSYMRPIPACRSFNSTVVEDTISAMAEIIKDPGLFRLFENSYPNTLDATVKWKGLAYNALDEELTFLITGDIDAMWLRDASNQVISYLPLLTPSNSSDSIASLFRGVINLQARYIQTSPHCNSFQPPTESNLSAAMNGASSPENPDKVYPPYSNTSVFECKYELDSLAAFLFISSSYHKATNDTAFFSRYSWLSTISTIINVTKALQTGTYSSDGAVMPSPYTCQRADTLDNSGAGNPISGGTGLIRSAFRPSDDATIFPFLIPSNLMFAHQLNLSSSIVSQFPEQQDLAVEMTKLASQVKQAVQHVGIVENGKYGMIYAYEVDGYGGRNMIDDANYPSLLSLPIVAGVDIEDEIYQNTRSFVLSEGNPYFMRGSVISAIGGPHVGPGYAWPMASIVRIMTSKNKTEISTQLREILGGTAGLGLIHESINASNAQDYTRSWFSWANGLFGQMILHLNATYPELLEANYS